MVICHSVISLLVTIEELLAFSSFFLISSELLYSCALLCHFLSRMYGLCLFQAVRRQLGISRPSCPCMLSPPVSGAARLVKSLGLVCEGWIVLADT